MARIDDIIDERRQQRSYDEELWAFMDKVGGRNLINLTGTSLQARLDAIDRNIQYLDSGSASRDSCREERGWLSPWWWLRARYWTLLEFEHRELIPRTTPEIPPMPALAAGLIGVVGGGRRLLVRISKMGWLMDVLNNGNLRFAPASSYRDPELDAARGDDELNKTYRRPGQVVQIVGPDGRKIDAIGDVSFSTRRAVERGGELAEVQYWMCSFSSDLDPRLFGEFESDDPTEDACLIILEPDAFIRRALPVLNDAVPLATKSLFPTDYYDPHHLDRALSTVRSKDFRYAYQREMRLVLDPEGGGPLAGGGPLFVRIGSIADIAGVYSPDGRKLAGAGPDRFLA